MELFEILSELEENEDIHLGRLLLLINQFSINRKSNEIEGLTKLAKLDFLLRYPKYLEKALTSKGKSTKKIEIKEYENKSIESKMVRYKYGPWDFRYRKFINILIGKGLVYYSQTGKRINIGITAKGQEIANKLIESQQFSEIENRSNIIKKNFDLTGSSLMKFIYKTFPEIGTLKLGITITNKNED